MSKAMARTENYFVTTAPGLEPLAAQELRALGVRAPKSEPGGVSFTGTPEAMYRANLHLRTGSRVLARAAAFKATAFYELERQAKRLPWESWVAPGRPVLFRVTCRKSKLYHSGAVAERLAAAVEARFGKVAMQASADEEEEGSDAQLFVVRLDHDQLTLSADTSGALLHRRGYRQALAKAPLRETLAAAMLLASGWDPGAPLLDPMCGSGTIPIEAALLARRIAPGLALGEPRAFAFERWPDFDRALWARLIDEARRNELPRAPAPILASDRDAGALTASRSNAARARVDADLTLAQRPLTSVEAVGGPGWLVSNPPYGVRIGEKGPLRELYASLGQLVRTKLPDWTVTLLLTGDRMLESQLRLPLKEKLATRNGGLAVRVMVAAPPKGAPQEAATTRND